MASNLASNSSLSSIDFGNFHSINQMSITPYQQMQNQLRNAP